MLLRATILIVLLTLGCNSELDRPIRILLPNDYEGEFSIADDPNGTPAEVTDQYFTYVIPASGELRTSDIQPFRKWHQLRVEYADGRVLMDYATDKYRGHGEEVECGHILGRCHDVDRD